MKFHLQFAFLLAFALFFSTFPLKAQERFEGDSRQQLDVLHKIERAYQSNRLTLDQKVLFKFYALTNPQKLPFEFQPQDSLPIKCGTPIIREFHSYRQELSTSTVQKVETMTGRYKMQAVEIHRSPSGRFLIYYEISGEDAVPNADSTGNGVPDYVDEVAEAADYSYQQEVLNLGYSNPIPAGDTYEIEIADLDLFYGQTYISNGTTVIQIENDFSENFPPNDHPEGDVIGAIKATIAHELKHAIQYAATQWSGETDLWSEMDATLMEEVVYDQVNDYYNYINNSASIFESPASSFYPGSYYHVSWALFFEERYGPDFWPRVWDIIVANPDIRMVNAMSEQLGSSAAFQRAYIESQLWHFASGPQNSPPNYGFEEREAYPDPTINYYLLGADSLIAPSISTDSLQPFSANYFNVQPSTFSGYVTVGLTDVSIPEAGLGIIGYFNDGTTETAVLYTEGGGAIEYQTTWAWSDLTRMGIVVANGSETESTGYRIFVRSEDPQIVQLMQNYPNPFYPETIIQFSLPEQSKVELKVYDITGRLVRTLRNTILPEGYYEVPFDGSQLASGVYFYRLITDEGSFVKKMTLIK
ncbi:MAG TPA: T9SS type A sorting domain-containing protein [Balneolaceae bacterium]